APGIIQVAALLASLLALERLFRDDLQDGSLEQLMLLPVPLPAAGQRLRVGGMVMPGSVRRDPDSLKVNFSLYDAEGSVTVS
ncbi:cytochrome c maturation protein CcmE, partial [Salmonella enterica subsp. enterica serovar Kentucky]|nr:cytochrome c maturation protein CcmE [Salmonella enterica subsp. enterica serovar Kentucky]MEB8469105.1 cytochrome c maturation protein CcmE [Salmonella enterica subsp. enterica serovar Kentucky]